MTDQPNKENNNFRIFLLAVLVLLCLFCFGLFSRWHQTSKVNKTAKQNQLPSVTLLIAKPEDKPVEFDLPSITQANITTPIWARADGYIKSRYADIGDKVKKDQLLLELETPDLDQKYQQAIHDYQNALAKRDSAKLLADRGLQVKNLNAGAISQEDLDIRGSNLTEAEASCNAFEANMNYYKSLMEFKHVLAPFDGIITERSVDVGGLVTAGSNGNFQQLFVIAASDIIKLYVSVPQNFYRSITLGLEGITSIREFGSKTFTGVVKRYAKALDPVAHTMLTELHIDNKDGELIPGLYAQVHFVFKPELPYFVVPATAIIIRESDPKIAVVDDDNIVHIKVVKIGLDYGKSVTIVDGITPGEKIITNPTEKIKQGVKVKPLKQAEGYNDSEIKK